MCRQIMVVLDESDELDTESDDKTPPRGAVKRRPGDAATYHSRHRLHLRAGRWAVRWTASTKKPVGEERPVVNHDLILGNHSRTASPL